MVQQSLRNVMKHSSAHTAKVALTGYRNGIEHCVSDPGADFATESQKGKAGFRLIGISERLRLAGGQVRLEF
jgi:signal transduction histidine kinase